MATKGTKEDPHIVNVTGDGAGLSAAWSGVRVSSFPGTTELLNQSSLDLSNWLLCAAARPPSLAAAGRRPRGHSGRPARPAARRYKAKKGAESHARSREG